MVSWWSWITFLPTKLEVLMQRLACICTWCMHKHKCTPTHTYTHMHHSFSYLSHIRNFSPPFPPPPTWCLLCRAWTHMHMHHPLPTSPTSEISPHAPFLPYLLPTWCLLCRAWTEERSLPQSSVESAWSFSLIQECVSSHIWCSWRRLGKKGDKECRWRVRKSHIPLSGYGNVKWKLVLFIILFPYPHDLGLL